MHGTYRISPGGMEESVTRLEALARLMDGSFVIPGTNSAWGWTQSSASCRWPET